MPLKSPIKLFSMLLITVALFSVIYFSFHYLKNPTSLTRPAPQQLSYSHELEKKVLALKTSFDRARKNNNLNNISTVQQHTINISNFPVKTGYVSSRFGLRKDPIHGKGRLHKGLDIAAQSGTFVYPIGKGTVVFSGYKKGYGNVVEIRHGSTVISRYAHLDMSLIDAGREIDGDEIIGVVGTTGRSTGPHLHLEVRFNGVAVNPEPYLSKIRPTSIAQVRQH